MIKRSFKKTSHEQFEVLKYEMSKHPDAAIGYGPGTDRNKVDGEWREIVEKLNAIGPPQRTITEWKKVWSDVRLRIKKRLCEEYSGKVRKSRKRKNESESEEDFLMDSLNNSNSIYASHSYADNDDEYHKSENDHESTQECKEPIAVAILAPEEEEKQSGFKKKTTSDEQFKLLKFEMSRHPAAAMGYGVGKDRSKADAEWKEIVVKLNAIGPPQRSLPEWKKVWSDVRLRIKKRMHEENSRGGLRKIKPDSETEEDILMEALNNSIYASHSNADNEEYDEPEIDHDPTAVVNISHEEHGSDDHNGEAATTVVENNPLEEDLQSYCRDSKKNIRRVFEISDIEESGQNSNNNDQNNFFEHTLYTLQNQMEQHNKLLEHLSRVTASMTNLMERHVTVMERRTQLMERQANASEFGDFLNRRRESRKRMKRTYEWF